MLHVCYMYVCGMLYARVLILKKCSQRDFTIFSKNTPKRSTIRKTKHGLVWHCRGDKQYEEINAELLTVYVCKIIHFVAKQKSNNNKNSSKITTDSSKNKTNEKRETELHQNKARKKQQQKQKKKRTATPTSWNERSAKKIYPSLRRINASYKVNERKRKRMGATILNGIV